MAISNRKCPRCGTDLSPNVRFCGHCGLDVGSAPAAEGNTALRVIAVAALLVMGCPLGVLGGLQLVLAIAGGAPVDQLSFGFGMLFLTLLFIGFAVWAFRKR